MSFSGKPVAEFRHAELSDTGANWTANNPVMEVGEWGYDETAKLLKIGDGVTAWNSLPYYGQGGDHSQLSNLGADDHPQYLTEVRHDALPQDNPHGVTATQVGADPAGTAASEVNSHEGEADPHPQYQTAAESQAQVDTHANRTDNPHAVNKTQVGLGNVDNTSDANKPISTATQTALDNKYDSSNPQNYQTETQVDTKISAVIDMAPGALDTLNELAAALGDDANFASTIATQQAAQDTAISNAQSTADNHIADTNNPHSVTAAQVGADPAGSASTAITNHEAAADPHPQYETSAEAQAKVDAHANLQNNPHNVTKAQVGLGNADNTSDANKPISTAQATVNSNVQTQQDDQDNLISANTAKVSADGPVSTHSDVDLGGIQSEDLVKWDGTKLIPTTLNNGFSLFQTEFEENAAVLSGSYEWSQGNGSAGPRVGWIVPEDCEFYGAAVNVDSATVGPSLSINFRRAAAGTADVNGSPVIQTPVFTGNNQIQFFAPGTQLSRGDVIIPQTNIVSGTWSDVRIMLFFRIAAVSNAAKTDIKAVDAENVNFNSATFIDIPGLSDTITLTKTGSLIGDLIYSAARSGANNAATQFRVLINNDPGKAYNDTLSTFNDTGGASHFLQNLPAGTYTISAQALTNQPILISAAGLRLTAREQ